jgi:putative polyketide hydroxylase
VAEETVNQVYMRFAASQERPTGERVEPLGSMIYGYTYPRGVFIAEPGENTAIENPAEPSGRPGTRAPHLEVERGGVSMSIIDTFGRSFVLLGGEAAAAEQAAALVAARTGVPIDWYRVAEDGDLRATGFTERYGVNPDGIVLVRPDGFVAWRAVSTPVNLESRLLDVLNLLLCRQIPASVTAS